VETVYSVGLHQLAPYLRSFMQRYPEVNLHVEYNRSNRVYSDVLSGVCDLGIVAYPWHHPSVNVIPFKQEKLVLICPPGHPLVKKRGIKMKDLEHQRFIAFDRDIPTCQAINRILRKFKVLVNVVHEFDNIETLKRSVEIGAGVSILPENTVTTEVRNGTLICVSLPEGPFYRPIGIIQEQRRSFSKATQEFIRWLYKNKKS